MDATSFTTGGETGDEKPFRESAPARAAEIQDNSSDPEYVKVMIVRSNDTG